VGVANVIPTDVVDSAMRGNAVSVQIEQRLQKVLNRGIAGNTVVNDSVSAAELAFEII
jgi:hypothetical protein